MACTETGLCKITPAVLDKESQAVPESPEDEVDGHAVPQADEQHRGNLPDHDHRPYWHRSVAAYPAVERVEKIGTDPLCQRHVPAAPELGQVGL